jgi:hypothetical protein
MKNMRLGIRSVCASAYAPYAPPHTPRMSLGIRVRMCLGICSVCRGSCFYAKVGQKIPVQDERAARRKVCLIKNA